MIDDDLKRAVQRANLATLLICAASVGVMLVAFYFGTRTINSCPSDHAVVRGMFHLECVKR